MEINIWQIAFQILNFGLVMFLLNKVLYKPVMKMLDDRAKKINEGMAAAEKNLKANDEIEKTKKTEASKARKEASTIISKAESDAKIKADGIVADARRKAKEEATKIVADAQKELDSSHAKLEKEAVSLAGALAKKALEKSLSSKEIEAITAGMLKANK